MVQGRLTRQLVPCKSKCIFDDLFVQISLNFEDDLAHCHPRRPPIKTTLSLSHTALISTRVHTNVGRDAHVEAELHSSEPLADGFLSDAKLVCADTAVVVPHAQAVIAPDNSGPAGATTGWHAAAAFARFARFTAFGGKIIEQRGRRRKGADRGPVHGGHEELASGEAWLLEYCACGCQSFSSAWSMCIHLGRAARLSCPSWATRLCDIFGGGGGILSLSCTSDDAHVAAVLKF